MLSVLSSTWQPADVTEISAGLVGLPPAPACWNAGMPVNYSGWLAQFFCPCALCPNIPGKCQTTLVSDRSPDTHQRLLTRLLGHLHQLSTRRDLHSCLQTHPWPTSALGACKDVPTGLSGPFRPSVPRAVATVMLTHRRVARQAIQVSCIYGE